MARQSKMNQQAWMSTNASLFHPANVTVRGRFAPPFIDASKKTSSMCIDLFLACLGSAFQVGGWRSGSRQTS